MTENLPFIEGAYLQDVLDQPRAIRDTASALASAHEVNQFAKGLRPGSYQKIVLTGMGGSLHVLNPLYLKLVELGFVVVMAETSELVHFMPRLLDDSTLLIVVSQSGRSAEIVRLLTLATKRAKILGVTNDSESPLAQQSDVLALIQAGAEASVSCKTTTASLAALAWIGNQIAGEDEARTRDHLEQSALAVNRYLALWRAHAQGERRTTRCPSLFRNWPGFFDGRRRHRRDDHERGGTLPLRGLR